MQTDFTTMSDSELQAEERRIAACLYRAEDTFSQMLLGDRWKAIHREIHDRPLWRIAK